MNGSSQNKLVVLAIALAIGAFITFKFTNLPGRFYQALSGNAGTNQCVDALAEKLQETRYKFSLAGVPSETIDTALNEMIAKSCTCIANAAGTLDVNEFIDNKDNARVIRECSETATGQTLGKYAAI